MPHLVHERQALGRSVPVDPVWIRIPGQRIAYADDTGSGYANRSG